MQLKSRGEKRAKSIFSEIEICTSPDRKYVKFSAKDVSNGKNMRSEEVLNKKNIPYRIITLYQTKTGFISKS